MNRAQRERQAFFCCYLAETLRQTADHILDKDIVVEMRGLAARLEEKSKDYDNRTDRR